MTKYDDMSRKELETLKAQLEEEYAQFKAKGLKLNMARGKPSSAQLDLSRPMLGILGPDADLSAADGTDCRNYGVLDGLPEAKELMAAMLDDEPDNVIVLRQLEPDRHVRRRCALLGIRHAGRRAVVHSCRHVKFALPCARLRPSLRRDRGASASR